MRVKRIMTGFVTALAFSVTPGALAEHAKRAGTPIADLYTLDCGLTDSKDTAYLADTGEYDGMSLALPTPC